MYVIQASLLRFSDRGDHELQMIYFPNGSEISNYEFIFYIIFFFQRRVFKFRMKKITIGNIRDYIYWFAGTNFFNTVSYAGRKRNDLLSIIIDFFLQLV